MWRIFKDGFSSPTHYLGGLVRLGGACHHHHHHQSSIIIINHHQSSSSSIILITPCAFFLFGFLFVFIAWLEQIWDLISYFLMLYYVIVVPLRFAFWDGHFGEYEVRCRVRQCTYVWLCDDTPPPSGRQMNSSFIHPQPPLTCVCVLFFCFCVSLGPCACVCVCVCVRAWCVCV